MHKITIQSTTSYSDTTVYKETILSFDEDELLNLFHLLAKAILNLQTVSKENR